MNTIPDFLPFPKDFLFGTAVSAFQVEGNSGIRKSDWDEFLLGRPDIVKPNEIGPQWFEKGKAEKDINIMATLGMQAQRLSFEWARIEPEEGYINKDALKRYRELIDYLHSKHITPIVTLNHYTLPLWIAKKGSWENPKIVEYFAKYVAIISNEFGDIGTWLTLNEPGVLIESGYFTPYFPPQHHGFLAALKAHHNMLSSHRKAYGVLKKYIPDSQVSMAFSFRWYRPENPKDMLEYFYANIVNYFDSINYIDAVKDTIDFVGCNFYAGYYLNLNLSKIRPRLHGPESKALKTILFGEIRKPGAYVSDLGAPIVPGFFLELLQTLTKRYKKPIIITENGIADRRDFHRAFYLLVHLISVWRAIEQGADIRQYFVWASVDNLEWLEGYTQEFGLIRVDPVSGEREVRKSAYMYKEIIDARGIDIKNLLPKYLDSEQKEKAERLIHHLFLKHQANLFGYRQLSKIQKKMGEIVRKGLHKS